MLVKLEELVDDTANTSKNGAARNMSSYTFIKSLIPPILLDVVRTLRTKNNNLSSNIMFLKGRFGSWIEASRASIGYGDPRLIERVVARNLEDARLMASGDKRVTDRHMQIFAAILVAMNKIEDRPVRVVDLGGELGHFYRSLLPLLRSPDDLRWRVHEQPLLATRGSELFHAPGLSFSSGNDAFAGWPHIVLASGVLQAIPDPEATFDRIAESGARFVILSAHPLISEPENVLTLRIIKTSAVQESYPLWMFSETAWRVRIARDFSVILEWPVEKFDVLDTGERVRYVGMLLKRRDLRTTEP